MHLGDVGCNVSTCTVHVCFQVVPFQPCRPSWWWALRRRWRCSTAAFFEHNLHATHRSWPPRQVYGWGGGGGHNWSLWPKLSPASETSPPATERLDVTSCNRETSPPATERRHHLQQRDVTSCHSTMAAVAKPDGQSAASGLLGLLSVSSDSWRVSSDS